MRVLLDNNVDQRFGRLLLGHEVTHARQLGWADLQNGDLVSSGESAGFGVLITGDKNLRYQQNLRDRKISVITLNTRFITYHDIAPLAPKVLDALGELPEGSFILIGEE